WRAVHWDGLILFLELDTNIVERGIRPIAADRDLQIERRRSASLLRRRAQQARHPLAPLASRRTHAVVMGGRALHSGDAQTSYGDVTTPCRSSKKWRCRRLQPLFALDLHTRVPSRRAKSRGAKHVRHSE